MTPSILINRQCIVHRCCHCMYLSSALVVPQVGPCHAAIPSLSCQKGQPAPIRHTADLTINQTLEQRQAALQLVLVQLPPRTSCMSLRRLHLPYSPPRCMPHPMRPQTTPSPTATWNPHCPPRPQHHRIQLQKATNQLHQSHISLSSAGQHCMLGCL